LPIVPIAIRGTRHILPSGRFLPRPGRIHIQVLPPLAPLSGLDSTLATAQMRDQARARILTALDEPDLSDADGVAALQARGGRETG
jgi:1-acyl-sn-glycerol-3-phosphate acyltransferase